jgi:hypothetical protein
MFEQLDFVYMPSRDVAADIDHYTQRLGAELVFAIEAFGTRVAMVRLAPDEAELLLAEHLEGSEPVLLYRVADLDSATAELIESGAEVSERFGFPYGRGVELVTPGPQRLAIYERAWPEKGDSLAGRRDF